MLRVYREWTPQPSGDISVLDQLPGSSASGLVRTLAESAIDAEGPIHPHRLAKLVASAFSLTRINDSRRKSILRTLSSDYQRDDGEGFYWPTDVDPASWRIVRRPADGDSRPLEDVSRVEIGNAMIIVAGRAGGISAEELTREALNIFGGKKMMPAISGRLDDAFRRALAKGYLRQTDSGLVVAG
jgi:hypothetical protein